MTASQKLVPEALLQNREATEQVSRFLYMSYKPGRREIIQCPDAAVLLDWMLENVDISRGCPSIASTDIPSWTLSADNKILAARLHQWVVWEACKDIWPSVDQDVYGFGSTVLVWAERWCQGKIDFAPKLQDAFEVLQGTPVRQVGLHSRFGSLQNCLTGTMKQLSSAAECAGPYGPAHRPLHTQSEEPMDPRRTAHQRVRMYLLLAGWNSKEKGWTGPNHLPPITMAAPTWAERQVMLADRVQVQNPVVVS